MVTSFEPVKRGKLTKKFLMDLKKGLYIVSNVHHSPMQSILAESVVDLQSREYQWKRIIEVGANGRLCYVFNSKADYEEYFNGPIVDLLIKGE
jgi:hypothetical protein